MNTYDDKTTIIFGEQYTLTEPTEKIKEWFFEKEIRRGFYGNADTCIYAVLKESEKAKQCIIPYRNTDDRVLYQIKWIPKSCIEAIPEIERITLIDTVEVEGVDYQIRRKTDGKIVAFNGDIEECILIEDVDYRIQIEGYLSKAY